MRLKGWMGLGHHFVATATIRHQASSCHGCKVDLLLLGAPHGFVGHLTQTIIKDGVLLAYWPTVVASIGVAVIVVIVTAGADVVVGLWGNFVVFPRHILHCIYGTITGAIVGGIGVGGSRVVNTGSTAVAYALVQCRFWGSYQRWCGALVYVLVVSKFSSKCLKRFSLQRWTTWEAWVHDLSNSLGRHRLFISREQLPDCWALGVGTWKAAARHRASLSWSALGR